jgi:hypothetical protein
LCAALAGCAPNHHAPPPAQRAEAVRIGQRYRLDAAASLIEVHVYRGGPLAAFGHNHVLIVQGVSGEFAVPDDARQIAGEFSFAVQDFIVDDSAARAAAGADFPGTIDAGDVAATRRNLLGPDVLAAEQWPRVVVDLHGANGAQGELTMQASFTVRGVTSTAEVPLIVSREGGALLADGEVTLSQRSLGLTPFAALLGALRVEDALRVRFHLVARRAA